MSGSIRILMTVNVLLYRLTRGFLGSRMGGQSVLLLHTVGHRSGKAYTTPVNYYRDGENYVVVASNWGKDSHPGWFHNLRHESSATVQVKDRTFRVEARQAAAQEYDRLWEIVSSRNPYYVRYQQQTRRKIPIVILVPRV